MPIAMVMMLSLEMFPVFPVWHISPTFPIWFLSATYGFFVWWSFNFPTFPGPTFSPFPFPLSPFPFPFSPFRFPFPKVHKQMVGSNNQNQNQIEVVTYTTVNNRCEIVFQTGGSVFCVVPFLLGGGGGGGGGGWKAPDSGGGGWVGGVSCEDIGVDNGGGGLI